MAAAAAAARWRPRWPRRRPQRRREVDAGFDYLSHVIFEGVDLACKCVDLHQTQCFGLICQLTQLVIS